jgi:hypothetical protein
MLVRGANDIGDKREKFGDIIVFIPVTIFSPVSLAPVINIHPRIFENIQKRPQWNTWGAWGTLINAKKT